MALKGHTKIELHNVKTGEDHIIESDNLVTIGASKLLSETRYCTNTFPSNFFSGDAPFVDYLFGGILLFKDPLDENVNNYVIPMGNQMVGNGRVGFSPSVNVPEFGSFNSEESSTSVDEVSRTISRKYVYDFGTSKGNGDISSVCLTNPIAGYYGCGNYSGNRTNDTVGSVQYGSYASSQWYCGSQRSLTATVKTDYAVSSPKLLFAKASNSCMYVFDQYAIEYSSSYAQRHLSNGKLKVYMMPFGYSNLKPLLLNTTTANLLHETEIDVPQEVLSLTTAQCKYYCVLNDKNSAYIVFSKSLTVANGNSVVVWEIGDDLQTKNVFTIPNTTGVTLSGCNTSSQNYNGTMEISDGYLFCVKDSSSTYPDIYKIKLSDPTDVKKAISEVSMTDMKWGLLRLGKYGDMIVLSSFDNGYVYGYQLILDPISNIVLPVNGIIRNHHTNDSSTDRYGRSNMNVMGDPSFNILLQYDNPTSAYSWITKNPFLLSTINNLDEPVTKTSDMTMKITYTLTGSF